jgi:hypothetical protein
MERRELDHNKVEIKNIAVMPMMDKWYQYEQLAHNKQSRKTTISKAK